ncbi:MAG TPA: two-component regulator propeller domain-containing protein [Pyrinomonadaceae bacterium]|jgi:ligand-binding sensor domain-containing protein/signal transduction histidine kinase|nr:two-component regulator propeller domain-containing protein [Pyrinomonadaceae bacterium]
MQETIRRGRGVTLPGIALACIVLACCPRAFALNPALDASQYAHTAWKIRDGFSKGSINSIAQTPDGYLWLGTEFGLLRFDGVRNVPWRPPPEQQLPSNHIFSLLAARDGTLWIGTSKGLASWKDGKLSQYAELAGQYIFKLLEDREGAVWAGGRAVPVGKLCAIRDGGVRCYGEDGALGRGAVNLYEDSKGSLWAGVREGLWRWKPGPPQFYALPGEPDGIRCLGEDGDGALLVGRQGGIQRFADGKTEAYPLSGAVGQFRAKRLLRDADGGLWIGTQDRGVVHVRQGRADAFASSDGLTGENVYDIFEDREGNVWVATINGLDRFRDFAVATFDERHGLSSTIVGAVLAANDGSVWFSTSGVLNRWDGGRMTSYRGRAERTTAGVNGVVVGLPDKGVESLSQDSRGRVWVATLSGIGYLEDDRFISVSGPPAGRILSMTEDNAGNFWVANEHVGLFNLRGGSEAREHTPWAALGREDYATTLAADPSRGGIWLGFQLGGVAYFDGGEVRASYPAAAGLGGGRVNQLRLDHDGTLWAATDGGLSRLKNGRAATLNGKSGLPCDTIHWTMEDDARSVWLSTPCGLVRVARPELDAWAAAVDAGKDAPPTIQATVFDSSDGVRPLPYGSHYSPQVAKSADGRLWFVGADGVGVIDPNYLHINKLPPPVHVEQITADRKTYDATSAAGGRLLLPPLIRDLQIDYTALSLVAPEKILFRYKLEGHDRDWQEVGGRRQAFYNDLPPGDYRFRVIACNNSGVWNETGTSLVFSIAPAYYQTTWFRVSVAVASLLLLGGLYRLRLRQVARQVRGRMEERLEERERIARDLHDTFLQSVQGLILKFHAVAKQIPGGEPAHDALEKTLDHADRVLAEGRDRVRNLRAAASSLDDLPGAFKRIAEETAGGGEATFKTVVEGVARELHPVILEESFSIGREALINALTHSGGRHVEVEITYDARQFRLRVRDDGRGIDSKILEEGGRPDHWGMQGMRERAQKIGAQLRVWSGHETGTEIELIIPGAMAYQNARDKSKRPRLRRLSGRNGGAD